jgi:hypothetical protein
LLSPYNLSSMLFFLCSAPHAVSPAPILHDASSVFYHALWLSNHQSFMCLFHSLTWMLLANCQCNPLSSMLFLLYFDIYMLPLLPFVLHVASPVLSTMSLSIFHLITMDGLRMY